MTEPGPTPPRSPAGRGDIVLLHLVHPVFLVPGLEIHTLEVGKKYERTLGMRREELTIEWMRLAPDGWVDLSTGDSIPVSNVRRVRFSGYSPA